MAGLDSYQFPPRESLYLRSSDVIRSECALYEVERDVGLAGGLIAGTSGDSARAPQDDSPVQNKFPDMTGVVP